MLGHERDRARARCDRPGARRQLPREHAQQRRLARPARAEQPVHLPGRDDQIDALQAPLREPKWQLERADLDASMHALIICGEARMRAWTMV